MNFVVACLSRQAISVMAFVSRIAPILVTQCVYDLARLYLTGHRSFDFVSWLLFAAIADAVFVKCTDVFRITSNIGADALRIGGLWTVLRVTWEAVAVALGSRLLVGRYVRRGWPTVYCHLLGACVIYVSMRLSGSLFDEALYDFGKTRAGGGDGRPFGFGVCSPDGGAPAPSCARCRSGRCACVSASRESCDPAADIDGSESHPSDNNDSGLDQTKPRASSCSDITADAAAAAAAATSNGTNHVRQLRSEMLSNENNSEPRHRHK